MISGKDSLEATLVHSPVALTFGTSGRRGQVVHLTQLEIYINALADLEHLQSLPHAEGGITPGDEFYIAFDLRPSSYRFVPEQEGRGRIAQAVERAVIDAGMKPVNLGRIPTPALAYYAFERGKGSIMVTGSHIPFDRNGFKTNSARGELTKNDEQPIARRVESVRRRLYEQPFSESPFSERGDFKRQAELSPEIVAAHETYLRRYRDFFKGRSLEGRRYLVYQHSAVGRDFLVDLLHSFGAEVIPAGRSEGFVPIDTENIDGEQLQRIQALVDEARADHGPLDAVVSTDGDSDRPMIFGVESGVVRFFPGDLVGMIVAEGLGVDAVVVPISCNDAVDRGNLKHLVEPKTRIGSPHVIAGMEAARASGKTRVVGWEANGGFLVGTDITRVGRTLKALPTRDAMLPILEVLFWAAEAKVSVHRLFERLPARFSRSGLLRNFPRERAGEIIRRLSPSIEADTLQFDGDIATFFLRSLPIHASANDAEEARVIREQLSSVFNPASGFSPIARFNYTDGLRVHFASGDIAHIRPSGNADEFRIYAVADSQARADSIVAAGVAEPAGLLRRLESRSTQT